MKQLKGIGKTAIQLVVVLAILWGVRAYTQRGLASGKAPSLEGVSLQGAPISLSAPLDQPVLVHFWATWCAVCKQEEGSIEAFARDHPTITVATQSGDAEKVRSYLTTRKLDMPVLLDSDGRMAARFGVRALPTSFFINRNGEILFRETGYTTGPGLRARQWLADHISP